MLGKQISHYRIVELIREGGMGSVYKAEDLNLQGHLVAIKVIKPTRHDVETANRLFLREAQAIARIDHPNVVTLLEVVQEAGDAYIVMPFVEGGSLRDHLQQGRLDPAEALSIASQVAAGLEAAHALGVVHRDLKPENVMVTPGGLCKILDFGVAHLVERSTLADSGRIVGTAHYMAPEQVHSEPVDARTDVYGLGVLLFEMLTGRLPFEAGEDVALFYEISNRPAPSILTLRPDLPPDLDRIVGQALNKQPGDRYSSVSEMRHDLEVVRTQLSTQTGRGRARIHARGRLTPARVRAIELTLAGLLVVAAVVVLRQVLGGGPPRTMVMRWENMTPRKDLDWLSSGVMDCLIRALGGREGLNVISRQTVTATLEAISPQAAGFAHTGAVDAAARVGATYLVTGTIEHREGQVRFNCELTDLRKGILVRSWSRDVTDLESEFYPAIEAFASNIAAEVGTRAPAAARRREQKSVAQLLTPSFDALTYYQKAQEYAELDNVPAALENLRRAVRLDSTFVEAHDLLARLSPEDAETERHLAEAMKFRFRASATTRLLVEAHNLKFHHQTDAAIRKYEGILAGDPEQVQARTVLAQLYMRRRRFADACAEFGVLHRISPYSFSFYRDWSYAYVEIGRDDKALGILQDWHRQFPRELAPLRALLELYETRGQYRLELALCDSLDQLKPGAAAAFRGFAFYFLGRLHEAEKELRQLLSSPDLYSAVTRGSSYIAVLRYRQGRYAEGLQWIEPVLKQQPETYNYWIAGTLAARGGDTLRAQRYAQAISSRFGAGDLDSLAAETYGERRFYYHVQGLIALAQNQPAEAVQMFEDALRYTSRGDSPYFRTSLGLALIEAGQPDRAVGELNRALELNPNYPEALLYLGRAYVRERRYSQARGVLRSLKVLWKEADADDPLNAELARLLSVCSGKS